MKDAHLHLLVALALLGASACSTHRAYVAPAPEPSAPLSERSAWYDDHKSLAVRPQNLFSPEAFLILEDGTRVRDPRDLLHNVDAGSPTALAAERAQQMRDNGAVLQAVGWTAFGVGMAAMLASVPITLSAGVGAGAPDADAATPGLAALGVGGVVSLLSAIPLGLGTHVTREAAIEDETAFLTYDRDLRRRLRLDEDKLARAQPGLLDAQPSK